VGLVGAAKKVGAASVGGDFTVFVAAKAETTFLCTVLLAIEAASDNGSDVSSVFLPSNDS
jgi:hypothetical protein